MLPKASKNAPTWLIDWPTWGSAIGSDQRYKPCWYERKAYAMGLRDAARIVEAQTWVEAPNKRPRRAVGFDDLRKAIKAIHSFALDCLRGPDDLRSED